MHREVWFVSVRFQVQLVQKVVDGVNLLVEMEKRLEKGNRIDDLIPEECSWSSYCSVFGMMLFCLKCILSARSKFKDPIFVGCENRILWTQQKWLSDTQIHNFGKNGNRSCSDTLLTRSWRMKQKILHNIPAILFKRNWRFLVTQQIIMTNSIIIISTLIQGSDSWNWIVWAGLKIYGNVCKNYECKTYFVVRQNFRSYKLLHNPIYQGVLD